LLPDGFTFRNIDRAKWSGLTDRKTIEDALAWLENSGWIRAIEMRSKRAADLPPPAIRFTLTCPRARGSMRKRT
jgi:hypothetical protein